MPLLRRLLDTPIRLAARRTLRELILIGAGVAAMVSAVRQHDPTWNLYAYAGVTALFALRFFAGRVIYLSMCMAAMTLQASCALTSYVSFAEVAPMVAWALALSLLLLGRDLVARFDDAEGGGLGLFRNYWRDLPAGHRRHLAWMSHAVGATAALVHHTWMGVAGWTHAVPTWMYAVVAGAFALSLLFFAGRAIAAVGAFALGAVVAVEMVPHALEVFPMLRGQGASSVQPVVYLVSPHYTVVGALLGVVTMAVSLPWALRWLRLAWAPRA